MTSSLSFHRVKKGWKPQVIYRRARVEVHEENHTLKFS
jgi:hypothetical protein